MSGWGNASRVSGRELAPDFRSDAGFENFDRLLSARLGRAGSPEQACMTWDVGEQGEWLGECQPGKRVGADPNFQSVAGAGWYHLEHRGAR